MGGLSYDTTDESLETYLSAKSVQGMSPPSSLLSGSLLLAPTSCSWHASPAPGTYLVVLYSCALHLSPAPCNHFFAASFHIFAASFPLHHVSQVASGGGQGEEGP